MRIAVDAMGGDAAPAAIVEGAVIAAEKLPDVEIILVGDEQRIQQELASLNGSAERIIIHHASQVISMDESVMALKKKRDSSIRKVVELLARKEADATVSAGNTAAYVGATTFALSYLKGVKRPGIAVSFPTLKGPCTVIDVGANIKCKPHHLYQYAVMANAYNEFMFGIGNSVVGLLNIGGEAAKGNDLVKQTHELLTESPLNFVGNVEGLHIYDGEYDVVVCEGFVGNVILKLSEGLWENLLLCLEIEAKKDTWTNLGLTLCKPALDTLKTRNDFAEYGGAPLLGVDGICIICHGRSDSRAIQNAIKAAREFAKHEVNRHIVEGLEND